MSYLKIPLTGAGEGIIALGDMLSAMRAENWYEKSPPDCHFYLGWQNWSFYDYDAQTGNLMVYLCGTTTSSLSARTDMGNSFLLLPGNETAQVKNRGLFYVTSIKNPGGKALYRYLLSVDGAELFCVPACRKISELTLEELYRMDRKECGQRDFRSR